MPLPRDRDEYRLVSVDRVSVRELLFELLHQDGSRLVVEDRLLVRLVLPGTQGPTRAAEAHRGAALHAEVPVDTLLLPWLLHDDARAVRATGGGHGFHMAIIVVGELGPEPPVDDPGPADVRHDSARRVDFGDDASGRALANPVQRH